MLRSGLASSDSVSPKGEVAGTPRSLQLAIREHSAALLYVRPSEATTGSSKSALVMGHTILHKGRLELPSPTLLRFSARCASPASEPMPATSSCSRCREPRPANCREIFEKSPGARGHGPGHAVTAGLTIEGRPRLSRQ